jgi:hypothetical protein
MPLQVRISASWQLLEERHIVSSPKPSPDNDVSLVVYAMYLEYILCQIQSCGDVIHLSLLC